ncbi:alkaline phosphatase family protein [Arthrobacter sp.]|uniref:alkaline phosphatase family protein n=1 Tax=Arthrobacter sp. TaxID=1667 RepID=UPI0025849AA0|nr:alkaline phosphatase family protein [Arthrobacter sp.]
MSRKSRFFVAFVIGFTALELFMAGCASPGPVATLPPAAPASSSSSGLAASPAAKGGTPPGIDHVVIIVEENKPASTILGDASAPYINKLAAESALATNYQAISHPSLPNYLALTGGTTAGITDDCAPGGPCTARVPSITDEIARSGRTWTMYAEGMPAPCTAENSGAYAVKHNPFVYYPTVTGDHASCAAHDVPLTQLSEDLKDPRSLPNYVFISPNLCNDMHDCPVSTGDAWLSHEVPGILASPAFTTQNSLLVVTWDEGENGNNTVSTIFAGPAARRGYESGLPYSHYSLLHTIESVWGLAPLTDNDRNAPVMRDMLK